MGKYPNKIKVLGNYCPSQHSATRIIDPIGISPTAMLNHGSVITIRTDDGRYRKLTPKEMFRLMAVSDTDIFRMQSFIQLGGG